MKKVFKIYLSCMMVLLIFILALPLGAFAATEYDLYVNGERFTSDKLTIACGSGTATFDPSTNTLTLNNATIDTGCIIKQIHDPRDHENYNNSIYGIYSKIDTLKVIVNGNNTISTTKTDESAVLKLNTISGFYCSGNLEISGNGKLKVDISDISYDQQKDGNFWVLGIQASDIKVTNTTIDVSLSDISISKSSYSLIHHGISTAWHCTLNSCNITANCDVLLPNSYSTSSADGMYITGNITLNNSNITAFGNSCGVICDEFNGNSGTVNASAKAVLPDDSSTAFSAFTLNLNGAVINATAESEYMTKAVSAYNANIKSGTINAECKGSADYSYGIWGYHFNMTGGNITAKACAITIGGEESYGIRAKDDFKISGGNIIASGYTNAISSKSYNVSEYKSPEIIVATMVNAANAVKTNNAKDIETALYVKISKDVHTHTFDSNWNYNEEGHWHDSNCGHAEKSGYAAHTFDNDACTVCDYKKLLSSTVTDTSSNDTESNESNTSSIPDDTVSDNSSVQDANTGNQGNSEQDPPADLTVLWIGIGAIVIIAAVAVTLIIIKKKK